MNKIKILTSLPGMLQALLVASALSLAGQAHALIAGWEGCDPALAPGVACTATTRIFNLTARDDFISTSDGNSHYTWGYAHGTDYVMQYPGPTLIVNQGDTVKILLNNTLPVPVSIVFPGQDAVTATGGNPGVLTREAPAAPYGQGVVVGGPTYTFVASEPGTYQYHSGTNADLQVEMGLVGVIIVRPTGYAIGTASAHTGRKAYQQPGTNFDRETLFLLTEMDPAIHWQVYGLVQSGQPVAVDTTAIKPSLWFINGRNAPDTQLDDYVYWLPTQPYNALPRMHPGERLLMRVVNAGRDLHPFHHHGNHATAIARDGRVLSANPADPSVAPDLTAPDFTVRSVPGQTVDLIYEWTGKGIGWDIYGTAAVNPHLCNDDGTGFDPVTREWCADHYKPIPVIIPSQLDISYGEHASGSPFLGLTGSLPQGHPGLNTTGGYYHMLHSHNEKEVTTDDIFPGGMMTMLIVEPWSVNLEVPMGEGNPASTGSGSSGLTVVEASAAGGSGSSLNVDKTTLRFGNRSGPNNVSTLTLMNTGISPAIFGAPVFTNAAGNTITNAFTLATDPDNNTCPKVPPALLILSTCQIKVNFSAPGGRVAIPQAGTLMIPYNGGVITLNLTGG
jgi:hypothetical protein